MKHDNPLTPADIRRLAEEKFAAQPAESHQVQPGNTERLIHELSVHQIQLEMQNEELQRIQSELDASRARYFDLYDLAPMGYCTVSEKGLILEANLTAAVFLGVARGALVHQAFTRFIVKEDEDIYYLHRKRLFETGAPQECEMRMIRNDGRAFWAHLAAILVRDDDGTSFCRVVMLDVSERKHNEMALKESYDELERFNRVMVDRELCMIELKKEINALLKAEGRPEKYRIVGE